MRSHPKNRQNRQNQKYRRFRRGWLAVLAVLTALLCIIMPPLATGAIASTHVSQTHIQAQGAEGLEQQGRAAYEAGDYSTAADAFQRAARDYAAQGQPQQQAIALANLSFSYQRLGQWSEAAAAIDSALELVPAVADGPPALWAASRGEVLSAQGHLLSAQGNTSEAESVWIEAAAAYDQAGQPRQQVQAQINQARMLLTAGFYSRALTIVETALIEQPDDAVTVDALRLHGDLLRLTGNQEKAGDQLNRALDLAKTVDPTAVGQIHISLGTLAEANNNKEGALEYYQQAALSDSQLGVSAQVNQLQLLVDQEDWAAIASLLQPLMDQLQTQPPNRETIYTRITVGQTLLNLRQAVNTALDVVPTSAASPSPSDSATTVEASGVPVAVVPATTVDDLLMLVDELPSGDAIATLLLKTYAAAQQLGDVRAQTYALSTLGQLYMQTQQWEVAKQQTLTALSLAQGAGLVDVEYQLQAQLCQILQNTDAADTTSDEAISACRAAVDNATLLRNDLAAKGSDASFNFQQKVEPIYRGLIDLLLSTDKGKTEDNLREARRTLELLQLAELDNFFREACLQVNSVEVDSLIDDATAVIYPIVLPNRLEIIVSFANTIARYTTYISETELNAAIDIWGVGVRDRDSIAIGKLTSQTQAQFMTEIRLRGEAPPPNFVPDLKPSSQQLYRWLISPLESDLDQAGIDTLVFVLDGNLRNVSMSALNDGEHYLVEKYAVALTPGLQLVDPKPIAQGELKAFLAGVSKGQQIDDSNFSSLSGVEAELTTIEGIVHSDILLNEQVTNEALEYGIATSSAPVVHIATHGKFGEKDDDTFIITWGNTLTVNELSRLLKTSELSRRRELELLVLSACETADGNDRAVLGLAGVATRSGARSTLATLWAVNDDSTAELMSEFYQQLISTDVNKAKALQQAQLEVLRTSGTSHPYYWAPFVLLGNWL